MVTVVKKVFARRLPLAESVIRLYQEGYCDLEPAYGDYLSARQKDLDGGPVDPLLMDFSLPTVFPRLLASELIHALRVLDEQFCNGYLHEAQFCYGMLCKGYDGADELRPYLEEVFGELTAEECLVTLAVLCRIVKKASFPIEDRRTVEGWESWFLWLRARASPVPVA